MKKQSILESMGLGMFEEECIIDVPSSFMRDEEEIEKKIESIEKKLENTVSTEVTVELIIQLEDMKKELQRLTVDKENQTAESTQVELLNMKKELDNLKLMLEERQIKGSLEVIDNVDLGVVDNLDLLQNEYENEVKKKIINQISNEYEKTIKHKEKKELSFFKNLKLTFKRRLITLLVEILWGLFILFCIFFTLYLNYEFNPNLTTPEELEPILTTLKPVFDLIINGVKFIFFV